MLILRTQAAVHRDQDHDLVLGAGWDLIKPWHIRQSLSKPEMFSGPMAGDDHLSDVLEDTRTWGFVVGVRLNGELTTRSDLQAAKPEWPIPPPEPRSASTAADAAEVGRLEAAMATLAPLPMPIVAATPTGDAQARPASDTQVRPASGADTPKSAPSPRLDRSPSAPGPENCDGRI